MDLYLSNKHGYTTSNLCRLSKTLNSIKYKHILLFAFEEGLSNTYHSKLYEKYGNKALFWIIEKKGLIFYLISIKVDDFSEVKKIAEGHGLGNKSEIKNIVYRQGKRTFKIKRPFMRNMDVHFYVHSKEKTD